MIKIIPFDSNSQKEVKEFIFGILEGEFNYICVERPDLDNISKQYQEDPSNNFWIAKVNSEIIGTIAVQKYGNSRGVIKRFYVKKELRKKGVGQKLFDTLIAFVKENGYKKLYLSTTNKFISAQKFYIKNNFTEIPNFPSDIDGGGDNVFMCREIKFDLKNISL